MQSDLTAYVPRLLLEWEATQPGAGYRSIDGTLVFADVSGFTKLSERLARAGGKIGAEQMTDVINGLFGELLAVAARRGGEMLKYGGDAVLLFFAGDDHAPRAAAASLEMQRKLKEIGRVDTGAGIVRLRMSVGVNSGAFDFFKVGGSHEELVVAGPATTECVNMEAAADATEVLVSEATASLLGESSLGPEKAGGRLLKRLPTAPLVDFRPLDVDLDASKFLSVGLRGYLSSESIEPDHRLATVAFLHLMDMDRQLALDGPDVVAERLDTTLRAVQDSFERFGVSFLATDLAPDGTKVMAATGAPIAQADAEERMLRALVPLVTADTPLPIRAGVNRGHVFAGDVGPTFRRTFTTIGDVTNTAARVMGKAGPRECLVLQPVLEAAKSSWQVERLDPFMAKGKTEPLQPFLVSGGADAGRRRQAPKVFIGRDDEVGLLRRLWDGARTGGGAAVAIHGEAGVGKSALIDRLVELAEEAGARVVRSECSPYEAELPYGATREAFTSFFGSSVTEIEELVRGAAPSLQPWTPLLALLIGELVPPTAEVEALDPKQRPARLHSLTIDLLDAVVQEPLLIAVEDAEHADPSSRAVLQALAKAASTRRWLITTAQRSSGRPSAPTDEDGFRRLELAPLPTDAALELVRKAAPAPVLPHDARRLIERSGGNPLFLAELLRDRGSELPESLEALFASRIDNLRPEARRLLRTASVLGARFEISALGDLAGDDATEDGVLAVELAPFLEVSRQEAAFRHGLLRDVAYEGLPYRRRRELHRRVAERMLATQDDPEPELLAVHFDAAGAADEAWTWSLCAADRAERAMAHATAAAFFARAVSAARRGSAVDRTTLGCVHRAMGEAAMFAGRLDEAGAAFARARRLLSGCAPALAEVHFLEGVLREHRGDREGARRWYSATMRTLDRCTTWWERPFFLPDRIIGVDVLRTRVLISRGLTRYRSGRLEAARRDADEALRAARAGGDLAGQAQALNLLHLVFTALRRTQPEPFAQQAIELFEKVGAQQDLANLLNNVGMASHLDGDWDAAADYYEQSQRAQEAAGHVVNAAAVANNRAEILLDQGHLGPAGRLLLEAVSTFDAAGHWFVIAALLNLATVLGRAGQRAEADEVADDAVRRAERQGAASFVTDGHVRKAEIALLAADDGAAQAALGVAGPEGVATLRGRRVSALLRARSGDLHGAQRDLEDLAREAGAAGERFERLLALRALSLLSPRIGSDAGAAAADANALASLLGIVDLDVALPVELLT